MKEELYDDLEKIGFKVERVSNVVCFMTDIVTDNIITFEGKTGNHYVTIKYDKRNGVITKRITPLDKKQFDNTII